MVEQHGVKVVLRDGMHLEGYAADPGAEEFAIQLDAEPEFGGQGKGLRPAKLLLVSLAGCMSMDVITILRKKQQKIAAFEVRVEADRAAEHPRVYTHIRLVFSVTGQQVDKAAIERAIQLSYDKYCPIANLIKPVTPIETSYEIIES